MQDAKEGKARPLSMSDGRNSFLQREGTTKQQELASAGAGMSSEPATARTGGVWCGMLLPWRLPWLLPWASTPRFGRKELGTLPRTHRDRIHTATHRAHRAQGPDTGDTRGHTLPGSTLKTGSQPAENTHSEHMGHTRQRRQRLHLPPTVGLPFSTSPPSDRQTPQTRHQPDPHPPRGSQAARPGGPLPRPPGPTLDT